MNNIFKSFLLTMTAFALALNDASANKVIASSYGYTKSDATKALQSAIKSGADSVIIDNTGSDWITDPNVFSDISNLTGTIDTSCTEITRHTQTAIGELTTLEDRVTNRITALSDESDKATRAMETVEQSLLKTAAGIEPIYIKAVEQSMSAQDRLD